MKPTASVEDRKKTALERADRVLSYFKDVGVSARLFGSVTGDRFSITSDVDFLILSCPDNLRYRIESRVEDIMGSIPFDVVYYDSLSENFKSNLDLC